MTLKPLPDKSTMRTYIDAAHASIDAFFDTREESLPPSDDGNHERNSVKSFARAEIDYICNKVTRNTGEFTTWDNVVAYLAREQKENDDGRARDIATLQEERADEEKIERIKKERAEDAVAFESIAEAFGVKSQVSEAYRELVRAERKTARE